MNKSPFYIPTIVFFSLVAYGALQLTSFNTLYANIVIWLAIALGSWKLIVDTWESLRQKSFALDYIALVAIATGVITENYFVAGVIVLMMSGGNALEEYAQQRAKRSLTALKNRLPNQVETVNKNDQIQSRPITTVEIGTTILIRKGEVVPLDGTLISSAAILDESSLTGEAMPVSRSEGELVRSGSLNTGDVIRLTTTVKPEDSTYQQIIKLVQEAEEVQTPFVQLADKLSGWFTLISLSMAAIAYFISGDLTRSLAILVIATPCPLILATPIALVGGMSAAARHLIIFKRLASLEVLARVTTLIFDKTGTLTLGIPKLDSITSIDNSFTHREILKIAASIEKNSLHPFALAIVEEARKEKLKLLRVTSLTEEIGVGLAGIVEGKKYSLSGDQKHSDSQVVLKEGSKTIAIFKFLDEIKDSTIQTLSAMHEQQLQLHLFTGDTITRAEEFVKNLSVPIQVKASLSPADKQNEIKYLQQTAPVAMIGDGINDAPALAMADVGLAFSHQQHTAASEAADVILLANDIQLVEYSLAISRYTMKIAKQSMYVGMALSLLGMSIALTGKLPPLAGAIGQEVIDVVVILNALRAAFWKEKRV